MNIEHISQLVQQHIPLLAQYKYLFLFLGAVFESLNSIILAGFLASIGAVSFLPILLICIAGEFINGFLWYFVGYFAGSKPLDRFGRADPKGRKIIETVENYFHRYSGRAIIITKLTWSLTIATMIMAGSFKYNKKKFALYNFVGSVGWVALTFFIGFVFGQSYQAIFVIARVGYIFLFFVLAVILVYALKILFKSRFIKSLVIMERFREIGERFREGIDKMMSE